MKNYFETNDAIVPFACVIYVIVNERKLLQVYVEKHICILVPLEQLDKYKEWLKYKNYELELTIKTAESTLNMIDKSSQSNYLDNHNSPDHIEDKLEMVKPRLTKERIAYIIREYLNNEFLVCYNSEDDEIIQTDEFVEEISKLLEGK